MSRTLYPPLPPELVAFAECGTSVLIATRDADLRPDAVRGVGVRVWPDRCGLTVFMPVVTSGRAASNLRDNGQLAVTLSAPIDHRTVQIKGTVREVRDAHPDERSFVENYRRLFTDALLRVGMAAELTSRLTCWPAIAAELQIAEAFQQTPGPDAGTRLGPT